MHDTHVHLDMLLEKIGANVSENLQQNEMTSEQKNLLEKLLKNHDFVVHSTVSWSNFELVWRLFGDFDKVKFLFGSHPELVNDKFNLKKYLQDQANSWRNWQKNLEKGQEKEQNQKNSPKSQEKDFLKSSQTLKKLQKLVGIGEIGLDYFYTQEKNLVQIQRELFISQINFSLLVSEEIRLWRQNLKTEISKFKIQNQVNSPSFQANFQEIQINQKYQQSREKNSENSENYSKNLDLEKNLEISNSNQIKKPETKPETDKNLPIVIHCRAAFDDLLAILGEFPRVHNNFLIHCFTGDKDDLRKVLNLGGTVAFGGILTYKNAENLRIAAQFCPLENLVLETDLPFLSPQSLRSQVCLPEFIDETAQFLAKLRDISTEKVWEKSLRNSQKLFDLSNI